MDKSFSKTIGIPESMCDCKYNMDYKKIYFLYGASYDEAIIEDNIAEKFYCDTEASILFREITDEELKMPFTIVNVGHYSVGDKHYTVRKNLNNYQLIYTISGQATVEFGGNKYECVPNSVILLDCNIPHRYSVPKSQIWEYKHIHFLANSESEIIAKKAQGFVISDRIEMDDFFYKIFIEMQNFNESSPYILSNYVSNILTEKIILDSRTKVNYPHIELIENAARYMRTHYSEHISISEISKNEFVSVYHFTRLFKEYYGTTPYDYLINYRISQAKMLLIQGKSITEISEKCGFGNANNFSRIFKKYNKISPGQYKKQHIRSNITK